MQYYSSSVLIATGILSFILGIVTAFDAPTFIENLKHWETIIAGWLALLGAAITITTMKIQNLERQKSKQRAARFSLAYSLSNVCNFSSNGISFCLDDNRPVVFEDSLTPETLQNLKSITEHYDNNISEAVGLIGPKYQLCLARSEDGSAFIKENDLINELVLNFAELHALSTRLFDFSRGEAERVETGNITQNEIYSAISSSDKHNFNWRTRQENQELIARRYPIA